MTLLMLPSARVAVVPLPWRCLQAMSSPLWRFGQCFGEKDADEEFSDADVLSAVEFDTTGNYLATGDKGGRIVVFERARVRGGLIEPGLSVCAAWSARSFPLHFVARLGFHDMSSMLALTVLCITSSRRP